MAQRIKKREITLTEDKGTFSLLFKRLYGESDEYNFEGLASLRKVLSNEKARLLHVIKTKSPASIYKAARLVNRDFKSVSQDLKLLERFGFIDFIRETSGKRIRLKPVLAIDSLNIEIKI